MSSLEVVVCPSGRAEVLDRYVEFVAARCRPNTVMATGLDLRVFFAVINKEPAAVIPEDVLEFFAAQRRDRGAVTDVVRLADGKAGLAALTIRRRLALMSGLFGYLVISVSARPTRCPVGWRRVARVRIVGRRGRR